MQRFALAMFFAVGLVACGQPATLSIDGQDQKVVDVLTAVVPVVDGIAMASAISLDDGTIITPAVGIVDTSLITAGVDLDISQIDDGTENVFGQFSYDCATCATDGVAPLALSGTINFEVLEADKVKGTFTLTFSGTDPDTGIDLGTVDVTVEFNNKIE
jgi:hypothetical protein